ncbi:hypothetical protein REPUB_Repub12eG0013800 [Reevesia pubescens]
MPQKMLILHSNYINRRGGIIATMASFLLWIKEENIAFELDRRLVAPEQTLEEVQNGVQNHAKALLQLKHLIDSKSWGEAHKKLRKPSSLLKHDIIWINHMNSHLLILMFSF